MKALVYQDHKTVSYLDVPDPSIEAPTDAIVRIEKTAIFGSDLHIFISIMGLAVRKWGSSH